MSELVITSFKSIGKVYGLVDDKKDVLHATLK